MADNSVDVVDALRDIGLSDEAILKIQQRYSASVHADAAGGGHVQQQEQFPTQTAQVTIQTTSAQELAPVPQPVLAPAPQPEPARTVLQQQHEQNGGARQYSHLDALALLQRIPGVTGAQPPRPKVHATTRHTASRKGSKAATKTKRATKLRPTKSAYLVDLTKAPRRATRTAFAPPAPRVQQPSNKAMQPPTSVLQRAQQHAAAAAASAATNETAAAPPQLPVTRTKTKRSKRGKKKAPKQKKQGKATSGGGAGAGAGAGAEVTVSTAVPTGNSATASTRHKTKQQTTKQQPRRHSERGREPASTPRSSSRRRRRRPSLSPVTPSRKVAAKPSGSSPTSSQAHRTSPTSTPPASPPEHNSSSSSSRRKVAPSPVTPARSVPTPVLSTDSGPGGATMIPVASPDLGWGSDIELDEVEEEAKPITPLVMAYSKSQPQLRVSRSGLPQVVFGQGSEVIVAPPPRRRRSSQQALRRSASAATASAAASTQQQQPKTRQHQRAWQRSPPPALLVNAPPSPRSKPSLHQPVGTPAMAAFLAKLEQQHQQQQPTADSAAYDENDDAASPMHSRTQHRRSTVAAAVTRAREAVQPSTSQQQQQQQQQQQPVRRRVRHSLPGAIRGTSRVKDRLRTAARKGVLIQRLQQDRGSRAAAAPDAHERKAKATRYAEQVRRRSQLRQLTHTDVPSKLMDSDDEEAMLKVLMQDDQDKADAQQALRALARAATSRRSVRSRRSVSPVSPASGRRSSMVVKQPSAGSPGLSHHLLMRAALPSPTVREPGVASPRNLSPVVVHSTAPEATVVDVSSIQLKPDPRAKEVLEQQRPQPAPETPPTSTQSSPMQTPEWHGFGRVHSAGILPSSNKEVLVVARAGSTVKQATMKAIGPVKPPSRAAVSHLGSSAGSKVKAASSDARLDITFTL